MEHLALFALLDCNRHIMPRIVENTAKIPDRPGHLWLSVVGRVHRLAQQLKLACAAAHICWDWKSCLPESPRPCPVIGSIVNTSILMQVHCQH